MKNQANKEVDDIVDKVQKLKDARLSKEYWPIESLVLWDKNPRNITSDDFERLKQQIKDLGEYKPLIVNSGAHVGQKGEVLGGNMRLRAYKALGYTRVWVSIVEPKTEAEKLKYALSDNDRAGTYVEEDLAQLITDVGFDDIDLAILHADLGNTSSLRDLLDKFSPVEGEERLDELSDDTLESQGKKETTCPACGEIFTP